MMSEMMDPSKMKVADLRTELQNLGLDTKGNKPALVERLKEALEGKAADIKTEQDICLEMEVKEELVEEEPLESEETETTQFKTRNLWCEPFTGFNSAGHVPMDERVLYSQDPEKTKDAEMTTHSVHKQGVVAPTENDSEVEMETDLDDEDSEDEDDFLDSDFTLNVVEDDLELDEPSAKKRKGINALLFEESDADSEFSGFEMDVSASDRGNVENLDDNPDDPQPSTSGAGSIATLKQQPRTSEVASMAIPVSHPSTSGVAHMATLVPQPSISEVTSVASRRLQQTRKLTHSHICVDDDSESDISDDEIDFMPSEESTSESDIQYSPAKRTYKCLHSVSVPYAVPKVRERSQSKTPATDNDTGHEKNYVGIEELVGGMVPGPPGTLGGKTMGHAPPTPPCAVSTPVGCPPRPMPQVQHEPSDHKWDWEECATFVPHPFSFDATGSGILPECPITNKSLELEYFQLYFDEPLMNLIVTQTNKYYRYVMDNTHVAESSRLHRWKDTTVAEMYIFLATVMLMPHIYKHSIAQYWSTDYYISTPIFRDLLSCNRFKLLLRMLHFSDKNTSNKNEVLYKIQEVFMYLKQKFSAYFYPFRNLVVDESLILFKGNLSFRQYLPSNHNRFGIKLFVLCDCETGLVLDFIVYNGRNTLNNAGQKLDISGDIVRKMIEPYLGKGHTLFTDNWYTSPMLADFLRVNKTDVCGTVRRNRKHMPRFSGGSADGAVQVFHANDTMALQWHDKRDVTLLSTIHRNEMVQTDEVSRDTNELTVKPAAVIDYTKNMQLIDKCNIHIGFVDCVRRSRKWYTKLFFHLVDIAMLNAYNMYQIKTGKRPPFADFTLMVIKQIVKKYHVTTVPAPQQQPAPQQRLEEKAIDRLQPNSHFLMLLPSTQKKKYFQKRCFVCAHSTRRPQQRKDTRYMCEQCGVALCFSPCFKEFHTLEHF
nr:piggyBac transposable element-derived protein 4-like isoform X2 [Cherax quadricarinatus]